MEQKKMAQYTAVLLCLSLFLTACAAGTRLNTVTVDTKAVSGTYTLMLHGCTYGRQIDNVAILVDEQSPYPVDIYDIPTSYTIKKQVPASEAIAAATSFVSCSTFSVSEKRVSRIADNSGKTIGYEVRPLYLPLELGNPDPLQISYFLREDGVRVYIRIDRAVEKILEASGGKPSSGPKR
jgi:hypothetical protein